jgi:hypothetical protein
MAHDIFVSYSSKDKPVADAICASLEARGMRVWIAPRDILPGMSWGEAIVDAISGSRIMVVVFSANSNESSQVLREVERAVNKGIGIIPFRIEDVAPTKSMEYFLSSPHWLDAINPPIENYIGELVRTVEVLLGSKVVKPDAAARVEPRPAAPEVPPDEWYRKKKGGILGKVQALFEDK